MLKLKIKDTNFVHNKTGCTSPVFKSEKIEWLRSIDDTDPIVYTDRCLVLAQQDDPNIGKIAWILEPQAMDYAIYEWIKKNKDLFKLVVSHDKDFCDEVGAKYVPFGTTWIKDWELFSKSKSCSIIASRKNLVAGHRMRHKIAKLDGIDKYGYAYKPLDDKADGLKDYVFSIVIENCRRRGYFTEKIIDCFATGTIPIYWGDPSIGDIFSTDGIIQVQSYEELVLIIEQLKGQSIDEILEKYNGLFQSVKDNFEIAKQYRCSEDQLLAVL